MAFVPTTNAARAVAFYGDVLGLKLLEDTPYAVVFDANGRQLRIPIVEAFTPQPFTIVGWNVANITTTMSALAAKGVAFERFPGLEQDASGAWASPGGAIVAWFKDPDGNLLSLTQEP